MGRVRCVKITTAAFEALTTKDPDALYFVNNSGDFGPESLDVGGEIWLGYKKIGNSTNAAFDGDTLEIQAGGSFSPVTGVSREYRWDATAGGAWNRKGTAWMRRILGGIMVFNQLGRPFTSTYWKAYSTSSYAARCTVTFDGNGTATMTSTQQGNQAYSCAVYTTGVTNTIPSGHVYYVAVTARASVNCELRWGTGGAGQFPDGTLVANQWKRVTKRGTAGSSGLSDRYWYFLKDGAYPNVGETLEVKDYIRIDLTQMFGAGNEPTKDDFEAMFQQKSYSYDEGTIVGNIAMDVISESYNLYDNQTGLAHLAGGLTGGYKIEGTYTSLSFTDLGGDVSIPTVDSNGIFSVAKSGTITVTGGDSTTCVHRYGDGSKSGYEDYSSSGVHIDIQEIKQSNVNVWPSGLLAIGDVSDEIVSDDDGIARGGIKRIGTRAYASGDESDSTVVTDGTTTAYVLQSAETVTFDVPIPMTYNADGWGIEFIICPDATDITTSMRCVVDYEGSPIGNIDIDGDKRRIEDWRFHGVDMTPSVGSANPISSGYVAQMDQKLVNADWEEDDKSDASFIKNKHIFSDGDNIVFNELWPYSTHDLVDKVTNQASTMVSTGVSVGNSDVVFKVRLSCDSNMTIRPLCAFTGSSNRYFLGIASGSSTDIRFFTRTSGSYLISGISRQADHVYTIIGTLYDGVSTLYVKDETTGAEDTQTGTYTIDSTKPLVKMFENTYSGAHDNAGETVYMARLEKHDGTVLVDFHPVKSKTNGSGCFYDTVSRTIITPDEGGLTAGDELEWNEKEYEVSAPNVVHTTGNETINGQKTFGGTAFFTSEVNLLSQNEEGVYLDTEIDNDGDAHLNLASVADDSAAVISGVAAPKVSTDAVNKAYVDGLVGDIETLLAAI